ncbi:MAG: hypothetical protein HYY18_01665 [Planctomycetes bacterium]|nr:hypothetical protein [Planctomycetota bacterium]
MNPTVVVAGPSPARRAEFIEALRDTAYRLAAETGRADAVLPLTTRFQPWCVAVDLAYAGGSGRAGDGGVALVRQILAAHPQVTVLALFEETTATQAAEARRAGASDALRMPVEAPALIRALDTLSNPRGEVASRKLLAARHRKALTVSYKAVDEGFFARRRVAVTTEIGLMEVILHAEEAFAAGRVLAAEIKLPGDAPLKAHLQVSRVEPLPGLGRFQLTLMWSEMRPEERERLKGFVRGMLTKAPSGVPALAK